MKLKVLDLFSGITVCSDQHPLGEFDAMWVRNHAVRRYSERVLGLSFRGTFDQAMESVHKSSGLTIDEIRSRIIDDVTPGCPATVLFRGTRRVVRGVHARYVVNEGCVHTCYIGNELEREDDD